MVSCGGKSAALRIDRVGHGRGDCVIDAWLGYVTYLHPLVGASYEVY